MAEPASSISVGIIIKHSIVALFGGFAHAINQYRNGMSKTPLDFLLLGILSSFFGVIFGLIGLGVLGHESYWTMALAGVGGWLGIEATGILIAFARNIIPGNKTL